ncbi:hypothetical protein [Curtobacterium sp. MCSS17_015]|uniref:hypothetical protein n=1 Tax=Curtobacterium sp. MCSS17_015 TaxID=2175666 RepID=UPI000DA736B9|nr:hypothetical protein [Curtobacterium sp. MCSS17_015]WIB25812.1 hypothetical protein DEJ18_12250 [Curtobacterium sp. MCSS17_015]
MANSKDIFVKHLHTGEIKKVTAEQREKQDPNYWVRVTGDVKVTAPEVDESVVEPAVQTTSAKK